MNHSNMRLPNDRILNNELSVLPELNLPFNSKTLSMTHYDNVELQEHELNLKKRGSNINSSIFSPVCRPDIYLQYVKEGTR